MSRFIKKLDNFKGKTYNFYVLCKKNIKILLHLVSVYDRIHLVAE